MIFLMNHPSVEMLPFQVQLLTFLRLKTHGVENQHQFSTPKKDMAETDDDAAAAALFTSIVVTV